MPLRMTLARLRIIFMLACSVGASALTACSRLYFAQDSILLDRCPRSPALREEYYMPEVEHVTSMASDCGTFKKYWVVPLDGAELTMALPRPAYARVVREGERCSIDTIAQGEIPGLWGEAMEMVVPSEPVSLSRNLLMPGSANLEVDKRKRVNIGTKKDLKTLCAQSDAKVIESADEKAAGRRPQWELIE